MSIHAPDLPPKPQQHNRAPSHSKESKDFTFLSAKLIANTGQICWGPLSPTGAAGTKIYFHSAVAELNGDFQREACQRRFKWTTEGIGKEGTWQVQRLWVVCITLWGRIYHTFWDLQNAVGIKINSKLLKKK